MLRPNIIFLFERRLLSFVPGSRIVSVFWLGSESKPTWSFHMNLRSLTHAEYAWAIFLSTVCSAPCRAYHTHMLQCYLWCRGTKLNWVVRIIIVLVVHFIKVKSQVMKNRIFNKAMNFVPGLIVPFIEIKSDKLKIILIDLLLNPSECLLCLFSFSCMLVLRITKGVKIRHFSSVWYLMVIRRDTVNPFLAFLISQKLHSVGKGMLLFTM